MNPLLEDQLRAAFQTHAGDISPSVDLADDARVRAVRLRRTRRTQIAAGVIVIAGAVAVIPWLSTLGPINDSAPPAQPRPSVSPVAETVLEQAHNTRSLIWTSTTIVDGSDEDVVVVPVALEKFGDGFIDGLLSVSRASGGYVVRSGPSNFQSSGAPLGSVSFVRPDGTVTTLGRVGLGGRFAVSPDGALVAFSADGARGPGEALVVTDLSGREIHRLDVGDRATVLSVTDQRVWFWKESSPDDAGRPSAWDFATGDVTRLALTGAHTWGVEALAADSMVLVSASATPYLASFDVSDPAAPRELWRDKGRVPQSVAFDGQGVWVLVTDGNGGAQMLSSRTGEVLGSVALPAGELPVWTANQEWVFNTFPGGTLDLELVSVVPRIAGPLTFTVARYPPAEIPEFGPPSYAVPGIELPPGPTGS